MHRGVYAVGHRPQTAHSRWMAAVLAAGPEAVLSHRDAGALLRLLRAPAGPVHVSVPSTAGRCRRPGLVVHRSRNLPSDETTSHLGIPVTTPERTLLDSAPLLTRVDLRRAIDEAERIGLCAPASLAALLDRHRGRPGAGRLRAVLAEHDAGTGLTRSHLEARFLELSRIHDLPPPQVNVPVLDYTADFLWPHARLVVETDGHGSHGTARAFQEDRARDARLTAAGYRTLRFTYADITQRPAVVADRIRRSLRHGS